MSWDKAPTKYKFNKISALPDFVKFISTVFVLSKFS